MLNYIQDIKYFPSLKKLKICFERVMHTRQNIIKY